MNLYECMSKLKSETKRCLILVIIEIYAVIISHEIQSSRKLAFQ